MLRLKAICFTGLATAALVASTPSFAQPSGFAAQILAAHNAERAAVGAPPFRWNSQLEQDATAWAQQLARTGHLAHAPRAGRGIERENLNQGMLGWNVNQMMGNWLKEKRNFKVGVYPDVSVTGDWADVSHYTQIIWPTTTDLGCGMASGSGFNWLVCRYSPGGNKDGKLVLADHPSKLEQPNLAGTPYKSNPAKAPDLGLGTPGSFALGDSNPFPINTPLMSFGGVLDKPGLFFYDLAWSQSGCSKPGVACPTNMTLDALGASDDFYVYNVGLTGGVADMFADLFLFTSAVNYDAALRMPFCYTSVEASAEPPPGPQTVAAPGHVMGAQFYDRSRFHLETTHIDNNEGGGILVDTLGGFYSCPKEAVPASDVDTKVEQPRLAPVAPPPPPPEPLEQL